MTDPVLSTFVRVVRPSSDEWADTARDRMRVDSGDSEAFAEWRTGLADGRGLSSAEVTVKLEGPAIGSHYARSVEPAGVSRKMTWNTRPAVVAGSADRLAVVSGSNSRTLTFDVTADYSAAVAADARLALRFTSDSTTAQWLRTATLELTVTTYALAVAPTGVAPSGTVGTAKPEFSWTAPKDITKVQVQVDEAGGDFVAPLYDSGELVSTVALVDTATQGPAWAGIVGAAIAQVRHFTAAGGWSDWAAVSLTYDAPTAFVVSNPGASDADATPPSVWTPAADAVRIISYLDGERVHDTGMISGPVSDHTPKIGKRRKPGDVLKRVHRLYDGVERVQPAVVKVTTETTWTPTAAVAGLSSLTVQQDQSLPVVVSTWTRTAGTPDEVGLQHGDYLAEVVDGPAGTYRDWTVAPNTDVAYGGRAVVNGEHSDAMLTAHVQTAVTGIWVVDPLTERGFVLSGIEGVNIAYGGEVVVHTPIDGAVLLRRTLTRRGPEGSISGWLEPWPGRTHQQGLDDIEWLAERPERTLRLILGDLNIPITHSSLQAIFDPERIRTNRAVHRVSFDCSHAGGE